METKKAVTVTMTAALTAFQTLAVWADAPVLKDSPAGASQFSQAQTIMGAQASPETKLDTLYNGGSAKSLGVVVPASGASDESAARHLDIGAAPAAGSGLDQASVPSPAASAQGQARVGYFDSVEGVLFGIPTIVGALEIGAVTYGVASLLGASRSAGGIALAASGVGAVTGVACVLGGLTIVGAALATANTSQP